MKHIRAFRILEVRSSEKLARETTSAETLMKLSSHTNWKIRNWVAQNPNTPVDALVKLSQDQESYWSRYWVAKNPNTPADLLVRLSSDPRPDVRDAAQQNPNWPEDITSWALGDEDSWL